MCMHIYIYIYIDIHTHTGMCVDIAQKACGGSEATVAGAAYIA